MNRAAEISDCGRYRYVLTRDWGRELAVPVVFVMLNPSTADATTDDPTIRRCIGFAKSWGYEALAVVNVYAYRATKPETLWRLPSGGSVRCGPDNIHWLKRTCVASRRIVLAWGAGGAYDNTARGTRWLLEKWGVEPYALAITKKSMQPAHPLYLRGDLEPRPFTELFAEACEREETERKEAE